MIDDIDAFFEHHGVKGQHWGVINKKLEEHKGRKAEKNWHKKINTINNKYDHPISREFHNKVSDKFDFEKFNNDPRWNNKPEYSKADRSKLNLLYEKEFRKEFDKVARQTLKEMFGDRVSPSKQYKVTLEPSSDDRMYHLLKIKKINVEHADISLPEEIIIPLLRDKNGHYIKALKVSDDITQSSVSTDSFFDHHGVKGMKRRPSPEQLTRIARVASGTETKKANIEKSIKTKLKAIADAIKAEEKKRKEYEDALKALDEAKDDEEEDEASEFIKKQKSSSVKEFISKDDKSSATSNE